jgi:ABC-2 type transport system permease protein
MRKQLPILRFAAIAGYHDWSRLHGWKPWLTQWIWRITFQTMFFALIGRMVGSQQRVHFILIGNAVVTAALVAMYCVQSMCWERWTGTLPLLIASPASPLVVFVGRSVIWIWDGLASAAAALFLIGPIFHLPLPWPRVLWTVPLLLLVAVTTYFMATFFGSLALRSPNGRNTLAASVIGVMQAIAGVNIPVRFFPAWVQYVASVIPLKHGLDAIRGVLAGAGAASIVTSALTAMALAAGWGLLAVLSLQLLAERGRRDGSLEFGG